MYSINLSALNTRVKEITDLHPSYFTPKDKLTKPHILVSQTKKALSKADKSYGRYSGILYNRQEKYLSIQVTKPLLTKALNVFNAFTNLAEKRGHQIVLSDSNTIIEIGDIVFKIRLREQYTREKVSNKPYDTHNYHPSGILCFSLDELFKKEWTDKSKSLEEQFPRIMAYLELRAQSETEWKKEISERRKIEEEQRLIKEAKEHEVRIEKERFDTLINETSQWHQAELIRAYVKDSGVQKSRDEAWVKWALEKADYIDPTINN